MSADHRLDTLPDGLRRPVDDGGADHLPGQLLPSVTLASTAGGTIDLATLPGRAVLYCFPRAGRPDVPSPQGWDDIPGARGCTPQSLAFRDRHDEIRALHATVLGLSTQTSADQTEIAARLDLPFPLLSDADLHLAQALDLPTFTVEDMTLIKRLTLVVTEGIIEKVFYPVFPPDQSADQVIVWLLAHPYRSPG